MPPVLVIIVLVGGMFWWLAPEAQGAGGTGLGLYLAKRIVELHGGVIRVASLGEAMGTEFTIELPAINQ